MCGESKVTGYCGQESSRVHSCGVDDSSGGSRILKRGVPVCDLSARRVGLGACPPGIFFNSGLLRSFLAYS